jgi:hypothetical protein
MRMSLKLGYSTVAWSHRSTIFTDDFICYGGSFFCVVSAACVRYARDMRAILPAKRRCDQLLPIDVGAGRSVPATALVNSGKLGLIPAGKHYMDFPE